jgi:hypothetical protein
MRTKILWPVAALCLACVLPVSANWGGGAALPPYQGEAKTITVTVKKPAKDAGSGFRLRAPVRKRRGLTPAERLKCESLGAAKILLNCS